MISTPVIFVCSVGGGVFLLVCLCVFWIAVSKRNAPPRKPSHMDLECKGISWPKTPTTPTPPYTPFPPLTPHTPFTPYTSNTPTSGSPRAYRYSMREVRTASNSVPIIGRPPSRTARRSVQRASTTGAIDEPRLTPLPAARVSRELLRYANSRRLSADPRPSMDTASVYSTASAERHRVRPFSMAVVPVHSHNRDDLPCSPVAGCHTLQPTSASSLEKEEKDQTVATEQAAEKRDKGKGREVVTETPPSSTPRTPSGDVPLARPQIRPPPIFFRVPPEPAPGAFPQSISSASLLSPDNSPALPPGLYDSPTTEYPEAAPTVVVTDEHNISVQYAAAAATEGNAPARTTPATPTARMSSVHPYLPHPATPWDLRTQVLGTPLAGVPPPYSPTDTLPTAGTWEMSSSLPNYAAVPGVPLSLPATLALGHAGTGVSATP